MVKRPLAAYLCRMKAFASICMLPLLAITGAISAHAEDPNLPGVSKPDAIVTSPPPEPTEVSRDPRSFRVGNTDVRISGDITVDVIIGDIKPSQRR